MIQQAYFWQFPYGVCEQYYWLYNSVSGEEDPQKTPPHITQVTQVQKLALLSHLQILSRWLHKVGVITATSNTLTQPSSIHVEGNWPFKIVRNFGKKNPERYFFCLVAVAMALNVCVCVLVAFCFVFYFYACRVMFTCWGESKDKFPRLVGQWKFYSNLLITLFYTNIFSQQWNCARRLCRCPGRACYMYIMKHRALWKTAYGKQMSFASQSAVCECAITAH